MHKKLSRMESSKEARRVMNRNQVDLSSCQFSCSGKEITLTGTLKKTNGESFTAPLILALIEDFAHSLPGSTVTGHCDNCQFSPGHISFNNMAQTEESEAA